MKVASFSAAAQNGSEVDLADDEKEAIKPGLADPAEEASSSSAKAPLRKKLKMLVDEQAQK